MCEIRISSGYEGDLAVAPVIPLIARVDLVALVGKAAVPFLPHCCVWISPEAVCLVKEEDLPWIEEGRLCMTIVLSWSHLF